MRRVVKYKIVLGAFSLFLYTSLLFPVSSPEQALAYSCAVQTDGKILAAGYTVINKVDQLIIARYSTAGTLDATFGATGTVITSVGTGAHIQSIALQADGKIVAAGFAIISGITRLMIARYTTNGSLDTTFGSDLNGIVTTQIGEGGMATGVAVQSNGKIVVAGVGIMDGTPEFALVKYNTDGSVDTGFGTSGIVITGIGVRAKAFSLAIQPADSKIVAVGFAVDSSLDQCALVRYNGTDGSLDTTFNSAGPIPGTVMTQIGFQAHAHSVVIQSDGKIVIGGYCDTKLALARYTTAGIVDATFGINGVTTTEQGNQAKINGIALQSDGKIVATGFADNLLVIARYSTTGSLDSSFAAAGKDTLLIESSNAANALALQSDGKIVIAGFADNNFAVVRFTTSGAVDGTWGVNGIVTQPSGYSSTLVTRIWDQKSVGTNGGTFNSGAWQTRTLNTIAANNNSITLSNNQFTLTHGLYEIRVTVPAYRVGNHQARLRNVTDNVTVKNGSSVYSKNNSNGSSTESVIEARIAVTQTKTFEVQHQANSSQANDGFGFAAGFGDAELYTQVTITRIS